MAMYEKNHVTLRCGSDRASHGGPKLSSNHINSPAHVSPPPSSPSPSSLFVKPSPLSRSLFLCVRLTLIFSLFTRPFNFSATSLRKLPPDISTSRQRTILRSSPMSPSENQPEDAPAAVELNFNDTELTLGLPGAAKTAGSKRGLSRTVDLNLATTQATNNAQHGSSTSAKSPPQKSQVVGWPPVRASRKSVMKKCKYVKVAADGAPYLRKVDLEMYQSYEHLLSSLQTMFSCLIIRNDLNQKKESGKKKNNDGGEYVPTYEDKDGDWMMVGDVPWNMFVESCKRIRLMMRSESEATGLLGRSRGSK